MKKQNDIKRILILGHTGFIGSHLIKFFQNQLPEMEIIGRSLPEPDLTVENEVLRMSELFDLNTILIMCAAIKKQLGDTPEIFLQNLQMTLNVSKLLKDRPVGRVVYFSSADVYGEEVHNTEIKEDTPVSPTSYYGMAKYVSERLLEKSFRSHPESSLVILRPPLVYGPGDISRGYGPSGFICGAVNNEKITLWGDGTELREFMFVDDLVKVVYHMAFHEYRGVLNAVGGKSHTFKEISDIISKLVSFNIKTDSRTRTKEKADQGFNNELLRGLVPDIAFTSLEDGIKKTFEVERQAVTTGS